MVSRLCASVLLASSLFFSSCSQTFDQRKEKYPWMYYGNYLGSGSNSPANPIDEIDDAAKRHDLVYAVPKLTYAGHRVADEAFQAYLHYIKEVQPPDAQKIISNARAFFKNPVLRFPVRADRLFDSQVERVKSDEQIWTYVTKGVFDSKKDYIAWKMEKNNG